MNAPFRQSERLGRLTTTLGPDTLALLRFDGSDHLNDLFDYRIEALATRDDLDFDALIGTHATVEIEAHDQMRPFDGIVTAARWAGVGENGHRYDLTLRPWFWLAGRRRNQRIFHNKTVVQIVQELLSDYASLGDPALEIRLTRDYPTLEYTVQYRESDLDFARRQLERHGISFHFTHAMGTHTLVLTDDALSHPSLGPRPFKRYDGHHHYEQEHFWDWAPERNLTTGAVRLTDYNFKTPTAAMEADRVGDAAHPQGQIESFDYPGDYLGQSLGKIVAGLRTLQERGADRRNRAVGDCVSLGAGMRLSLSGDAVPGTGESYLCLSATHHFVSESYGSGGAESDGYAFTGSYTLMPDTAPMAPPRRTAAAVVQGPQTAMVVGEGEIDCDEYGRILVRFHWDLTGAHSMRCRVSQNWAGNGWGGMVIPRIGMEVLVEFLEGDPDKPLVTGCVYNGKNDVPYELPRNKTVSTFRTNSHDSKRTGRGFNELRFEDQEREEEIFMHAQKDMNVTVRNDHHRHVNGFEHRQVAKNSTRVVMGRDAEFARRSKSIGSAGTIEIAAGDDISVAGIPHTAFDGTSAVKLDHAGLILDDQVMRSSRPGSLVLSSRSDSSISAGKDITLAADDGFFVSAGKALSLSAGGSFKSTAQEDIQIAAGQRLVLGAAKALVLSCGKSRLVLKASGEIELVGTEITVAGDKIWLN